VSVAYVDGATQRSRWSAERLSGMTESVRRYVEERWAEVKAATGTGGGVGTLIVGDQPPKCGVTIFASAFGLEPKKEIPKLQ
jgi:hypothetical protein